MSWIEALLTTGLLLVMWVVVPGALAYLFVHGGVHKTNEFCTRLCITVESKGESKK